MTTDQEFDQKAATFYSVARFLAEGKVPEGATIGLELFYIPTDDADQPAFLKALKTFGYDAKPEANQPDTILITVATKMTAEDIWLHEERTSKLAQTRGYTPDGWGFLEPDA